MTSNSQARPLARYGKWASGETTGGLLLLIAAVMALTWANSPWQQSYYTLSSTVVGPASLHLDLPLATWAADGLLAIFFFVVGVELKRELVVGSLRNPKEAAVPVIAAIAGMATPALLYTVIIMTIGDRNALTGWAIPTATDIAFALAVLAVFGTGLPRAIRTFLLTLAVVDDLLAIIVIAAFYTHGLEWTALGASCVFIAAFALAVRMRRLHWWLLIPLAIMAWYFMHASGVHATIAGVAMGLTVPARPTFDEDVDRAKQLERAVRPYSSGLILPVFAFFAAGVTVMRGQGPLAIITDPVFIAVATALVLGKFIGVLGATALVTKITPLRLPDAIGMRDMLPVGFLTGIGFTVSLLITELSFEGRPEMSAAKVAVLGGSFIAAVAGALTLRLDARRTRGTDMNEDGIPDMDTDPLT